LPGRHVDVDIDVDLNLNVNATVAVILDGRVMAPGAMRPSEAALCVVALRQ
jgi:hypothetical protein